jgi:hypothetical protein
MNIAINMLRHMRTSIDIPDALLVRARRLAESRGTTLREVVLDGLRAVVEQGTRRPAPFRLRDAAFGEGGLAEGLDETDWDRIRDLAYEGRGA